MSRPHKSNRIVIKFITACRHIADAAVTVIQIGHIPAVMVKVRTGYIPAASYTDIIITAQGSIGYKQIIIICLFVIDDIRTFDCPVRP